MSNKSAEPKKDWSLAEWVTNFIQDDVMYYEEGLYDDIFDDTIGEHEHHGVDDDEANLELLFIFGLFMTLAGLLYYRQIRQREQGRQGREAEGERGVFPAPGDPEVANWAAGGVGH